MERARVLAASPAQPPLGQRPRPNEPERGADLHPADVRPDHPGRAPHAPAARRRPLSHEEFAASVGLDPEYVGSLKVQGISDNLILTVEGQIKYGLNSGQARDLNVRLRELLDRVKAHDARTATLESETDNEVVLNIPPFPAPNVLRDELRQALESIGGGDFAGQFLSDNHSVLSRELMGFGEHRRVITIADLNQPIVRITDKQFDATGSPFTRSWASPMDEVPARYRHFITLEVEE